MLVNSKIFIGGIIIIAATIIAGAMFFTNQEPKVDPQKVGEKAIKYINQNILQGKSEASLVKISEEDQVFKLTLKIGEREFTSYVSKDGKFLFPQGYDLETQPESQPESQPEAQPKVQNIPKKDKPEVKLFVMSYCPFGLQMEKAFLPVYNLLKDKADMGIYFVDYVMHGKKEIAENLTQYCIQEEELSKFYNYLSCFVMRGDSEKCRSDAEIDESKIENCRSETDQEFNITNLYEKKESWLNGRFPQFPIHTKLNKKYGVQGSPTVVINDTKVNITPRSPENFKKIICSAMNSPAAACSQNLSDGVPAAGIGEERAGGSSGQCK